jgi:hypothetical protein
MRRLASSGNPSTGSLQQIRLPISVFPRSVPSPAGEPPSRRQLRPATRSPSCGWLLMVHASANSTGVKPRRELCGRFPGVPPARGKSREAREQRRGGAYTFSMPRRTLKDLSWDECFMLLGQETVGRFVYADDLGPAAVPVNYALAGQDVVFRSEDGSKVRSLRNHGVAFEVDHIDDASRSGWSVLVRGTSEEVEMERVPARCGGSMATCHCPGRRASTRPGW